MRSSVTSSAVVAGLLAGLASVYGCSGGDTNGSPTPNFNTSGSAGTPANTSGSTGTAAGSGTGGSAVGTAGSAPMGGSVGTAGTATTMAGSGMGGATAGGMSGGGGGGAGTAGTGTAGTGGAAGLGDPTKVVKSDGCGKAAGVMDRQRVTIPTMGVKAADCAAYLPGPNNTKIPKCGPWGQPSSEWQKTPLMREYEVYLPTGYSMDKAYPLVFEGPGCGGGAGGVYDLGPLASSAIRVGLTPADRNIVGHGTNPNQGCFDDKEGDDSLDWVFYENLYDTLNTQVCFDRNRVFTVGDSSGSWFSNELGCKYAGDPKRPVRGVLPNTGGLPNTPNYEPTCTKAPMAGMWIHEKGDTENPFSGNKFAISRAMTVNGCTGSADYDDAVMKQNITDFPVGTDMSCKLIKNCPELYPLVVCALEGTVHQSHANLANPGFAKFISQFSMGNFLTQ